MIRTLKYAEKTFGKRMEMMEPRNSRINQSGFQRNII